MRTNLDQAPCLYFSSSDDGTLVEVNQFLCTKLGYSKEELVGQKVEKIFTLATRIFQQTHLFPLVKIQGHAEEIYVTLQAKDKEEVPILLNAERKVIEHAPLIMYTGIVVYNRKKFEEELIAAKKAAETALHENTALMQAKRELQLHMEQLELQIRLANNQNEELRQFNRVVTHDLQEPLRKLSVFGNMILDDHDRQSQQLIVEKLMRVSEQMRSIVSGLQQYVWLTEKPLEAEKINLDQVLKKVQGQLEKEYPQVHLHVEAEALPSIRADRDQVQMLFYHLLTNAIRFRKSETEAHVRLSGNSLLLNKYRNVKGKYQYGEFIKLEVQDRGIGFDASYKEQAFELFRRLHGKSGRGVGLSLCKKIVDNHHGEISIDSREGEGTTVTILLPME